MPAVACRASTARVSRNGHRRGSTDRVQRSVHGDQVITAEELIQLDVVDVAAGADLGGVQHREHVIVIHMDLRDVIAFHAVPHRDLMKPEHVGEHPGLLPGTQPNVHPNQRIGLVQERAQLAG